MKNDAETEGRGDAVTDAGKPWWQSRTIIGAVAAILSAVLGLVLRSDVASSEDIAAILTAAGTVVGGVLAIYGRIKAEKPIEIRRAVRATPEEISRAQRSTPAGRGGLNKGDALVRLIVLLFVTLAVLSLVLAFTGCSTLGRLGSHPTDQKRMRVLAGDLQSAELIAEIRKADFTPALLETSRAGVLAQTVFDVPFHFGVGLALWPVAIFDENDAPTKILFPFLIVGVGLQAQGMALDYISNLESAAK